MCQYPKQNPSKMDQFDCEYDHQLSVLHLTEQSQQLECDCGDSENENLTTSSILSGRIETETCCLKSILKTHCQPERKKGGKKAGRRVTFLLAEGEDDKKENYPRRTTSIRVGDNQNIRDGSSEKNSGQGKKRTLFHSRILKHLLKRPRKD